MKHNLGKPVDLKDGLRGNCQSSLWKCLRGSLWDSLWNSLIASLGNSPEEDNKR